MKYIDDQHRNPNMNYKDHRVGQLTRLICAKPLNLCIRICNLNLYICICVFVFWNGWISSALVADMCHKSQFVGNPPRRCLCLFPPPGLPTNSNILRRISPMMLLMVTMISVIFKMSGVAQSGFCRKFPFWAFCPFFPTAENGPQEKLLPVHYFCSSLIVHTRVCHISNAWTNGE